MFDNQEPEASDDQETNLGTGSLALPPRSGATNKGTRSLNPEKVRHMLFGSLAGIDRTIKILHALGYADPNDWSEPIPAPLSGIDTRSSSGVETWMAILTKILLIE
ncbi:hypothetical protein C7293_11155 [filamentous cyanobacterium CCT1]|nr:hypothetical protein C7293_11155 [filamentous cyanobacterium CCT1]PSN79808.1 hypothetical protein C8B47_09790 [filamentous cyanobacterium CCP4]